MCFANWKLTDSIGIEMNIKPLPFDIGLVIFFLVIIVSNDDLLMELHKYKEMTTISFAKCVYNLHTTSTLRAHCVLYSNKVVLVKENPRNNFLVENLLSCRFLYVCFIFLHGTTSQMCFRDFSRIG